MDLIQTTGLPLHRPTGSIMFGKEYVQCDLSIEKPDPTCKSDRVCHH